MREQAVGAWCFAKGRACSCARFLSTRPTNNESMATRPALPDHLESDLRRLAEGRHHDPHGVLGLHESAASAYVLLHIPAAQDVRIDGRLEAQRMGDTDFFAWSGARGEVPTPYRVSWTDSSG